MPVNGDLRMKMRRSLLFGFLILALLCPVWIAAADDNSTTIDTNVTLIATPPDNYYPGDVNAGIPVNETISPGNPLYGLMIAMEDWDETFTFNNTQRLEKQMIHANLRIAEVQNELLYNRSDAAELALNRYYEKLNQTQAGLSFIDANSTGLLRAQEMISHHQVVLEDLLNANPNSTGLSRAYTNSLSLQQKFQEKVAARNGQNQMQDLSPVRSTARQDISEQYRQGNGTGNQSEFQNRQWTENNGSNNNNNAAQDAAPGKMIQKTTQSAGTQKQPVTTGTPQNTQSSRNNGNGTDNTNKNGNSNANGRNK